MKSTIKISEYLSLALTIEYLVITHRESQEIIYYRTAGDFNPDFLDIFRSSVQYELLDFPKNKGEIEQATLEGKYLITKTGRMVWVTLITDQRTFLMTREILSSFTKKFEKTFNQELKDLYTILEGNVSIFRQGSRLLEMNNLINSEFYLQYTAPYKIGSLKSKNLTPVSKKIYQLAKSLLRKKKNSFLLKNLLSKTNSSPDFNSADSSKIIYELVQNNALIPVQSDLSKKKLIAQ